MTLAHVTRYFRDPAVSGWRKFLGVAAMFYVVLPIDLIPDVIPVLGWLDDVGVVALAVTFLSRDISRHAQQPRVQVIDGVANRIVDVEPVRHTS